MPCPCIETSDAIYHLSRHNILEDFNVKLRALWNHLIVNISPQQLYNLRKVNTFYTTKSPFPLHHQKTQFHIPLKFPE
jgi:hypothetical protein